MGFINPAPPPVDVAEWKKWPHLERIKPLAQDWAVNGFGTPYAIHVLYIVKLAIFALGAYAVIGATPGLSGGFSHWWTKPIVFEKLAVWMVLWEMLGLGSGSMPLTFRFLPPIGNVLYWLRPGTIRLPAWPDKVPLTKGSTRTLLDVALYAGVLGTGVALLASGGDTVAGVPAARLDPALIAVMLGLWGLLGLRDKVAYMSGRPEVYGMMLVVGLFPITNFIVGWQIAMLTIWFGAASSKLNHHFSSVVAVMITNTPWQPRFAKRRMWRDHPNDLRASRNSTIGAHTGTVVEYTLPLVMFFSRGGTVGTIAVIGMVIFHSHITSTFPLGVPLEWNLFMIFGVLFLFGHYGDVPFSTFTSVPLLVLLLLNGVAIPVLGNMRPDLISFLPSMRYYAGNWASSQWLFRKDTNAEEKLDTKLKKSAPVVAKQLGRIYGADGAELFLYKGLAFRAMHAHGRALLGLLPHAAVGGEVEDYTVREGELIAGVVAGWNFGDGHWHGRQLLEAIQERCHFAPGELRIVTLESQPVQVQRQKYKIYDAADGLIEEGYVEVADMISHQPWLGGAKNYDFPVHVTSGFAPEPQPPAATPPEPASAPGA
jgi:hypothetical protein